MMVGKQFPFLWFAFDFVMLSRLGFLMMMGVMIAVKDGYLLMISI